MSAGKTRALIAANKPRSVADLSFTGDTPSALAFFYGADGPYQDGNSHVHRHVVDVDGLKDGDTLDTTVSGTGASLRKTVTPPTATLELLVDPAQVPPGNYTLQVDVRLNDTDETHSIFWDYTSNPATVADGPSFAIPKNGGSGGSAYAYTYKNMTRLAAATGADFVLLIHEDSAAEKIAIDYGGPNGTGRVRNWTVDVRATYVASRAQCFANWGDFTKAAEPACLAVWVKPSADEWQYDYGDVDNNGGGYTAINSLQNLWSDDYWFNSGGYGMESGTPAVTVGQKDDRMASIQMGSTGRTENQWRSYNITRPEGGTRSGGYSALPIGNTKYITYISYTDGTQWYAVATSADAGSSLDTVVHDFDTTSGNSNGFPTVTFLNPGDSDEVIAMVLGTWWGIKISSDSVRAINTSPRYTTPFQAGIRRFGRVKRIDVDVFVSNQGDIFRWTGSDMIRIGVHDGSWDTLEYPKQGYFWEINDAGGSSTSVQSFRVDAV